MRISSTPVYGKYGWTFGFMMVGEIHCRIEGSALGSSQQLGNAIFIHSGEYRGRHTGTSIQNIYFLHGLSPTANIIHCPHWQPGPPFSNMGSVPTQGFAQIQMYLKYMPKRFV